VLGLFAFSLTASGQMLQDEHALHVATYCIKVMPGKAQEFEAFMLETGHKLAQAAVDANKIAGMSLSRAVSPAGEEARCSYLLAHSSEGVPPEPLDRESLAERLKKIGSSMTAPEYIARRDSMSKLVTHERFVRYAGFGQTNKGDYWQVNFMKPRPGKTGEFYEFERKTWMPLAQEAAERGHPRKAWSGYHLLYPSGTGQPYSGVTVDVFRDWASVWKPQRFSEDVIKKVFPGQSIEELFKPLSELRDLVRRDLFVQIDNVRKAP
jgi:hypothetical protein